MNWDIIRPYINQIVKGFFTALAPIVAAIGIVLENKNARRRELESQKSSLKVDILNNLYDMTIKISHDDILRQLKIEEAERGIISEIIKTGTSNYLNEYIDNNTLFLQRVFDVAMYKQEIRVALNIDVSYEKLIEIISESIKQIQSEMYVIDYATRQLILLYSKNRDRETSIKELIISLKENRSSQNCKNKIDVYDEILQISDIEKEQLKEIIISIVDEYSIHRTYDDFSKELNRIEKQLAELLTNIWKWND